MKFYGESRKADSAVLISFTKNYKRIFMEDNHEETEVRPPSCQDPSPDSDKYI